MRKADHETLATHAAPLGGKAFLGWTFIAPTQGKLPEMLPNRAHPFLVFNPVLRIRITQFWQRCVELNKFRIETRLLADLCQVLSGELFSQPFLLFLQFFCFVWIALPLCSS